MRFVFLSYNYSPDIGSPAAWVDRLKFYIGALEELAKTHTVIRIDQVNYEGHFFHNGVEYYCVDDGKRKNYFPLQLHRFVKSLEPDIIVVSSFLFPLQVLQLRRNIGSKVKIVIQNHADKPFTGIKRYLQFMVSRSVNAFVFASKAMGEEWVNKGNIDSAEKIVEIVGGSSRFHPVTMSEARTRTGITGHPVFLWVGRLNENKDPLLMLDGFLSLAEEQPSAKLYMIYQEEELLNEVKAVLETHPRKAAVVLVGKVPNENLQDWYCSTDFYIAASHYEGSGTALGEALSCGCIPVVSDIFSFRFITGNGYCGLLFKPGDKHDLREKLQQAMALNKAEYRQRCVDRFASELSFPAIALRFQTMAASLLR